MSAEGEGARVAGRVAAGSGAAPESALRRTGAWVGLLLGALGAVEIAIVLARGGGYYVVVPRLGFMVPVAAAGLIAALAALEVGGERTNAVVWLGVVVAAGIGWNICAYSLKFGRATWDLLVPRAHPAGADFRDGLYDPARAFTTAHSGWPPLSLYLGKAFTLVGLTTGYHIQVVVLLGLAIVSTWLSAHLAMRAVGGRSAARGGRPLETTLVAAVCGLWLLTSYGFLYEIDRGNVDLYALGFALLALWLTVRGTRSPWPPAVALAVATGLKLYPAILVVVLVWRYRLRAVVPVVVTTAVVLLVAGPAQLAHTVTALQALSTSRTQGWWGQDSATAMAHVVREHTGWAPAWIFWPLIAAPAALWVATVVALVRRGWSERGAVLLGAACMPMMAIVPPVSNDYKLVLCVLPLAVLATVLATARRGPGTTWVVLFTALSLALILLARSTVVIAASLQGSKYTLLVVLQVLLLVSVRLGEPEVAADVGAGPSAAGAGASAAPLGTSA
jgi:hypothetical protein